MHVSKDVSYKDNNIILSYVYQVLDVNLRRMFWTVIDGKYRIVNEHVLNNSQDNVVTLGIATSMANIVARGHMEKPIVIFQDSKFLSQLRNHHLSIFVILLTKMALPLLMLLCLFLWIHELMKSKLFGWKCRLWIHGLTKSRICGWKCRSWIHEVTRCNLCEWKCHNGYFL